jgi:hypothetical protein
MDMLHFPGSGSLNASQRQELYFLWKDVCVWYWQYTSAPSETGLPVSVARVVWNRLLIELSVIERQRLDDLSQSRQVMWEQPRTRLCTISEENVNI